MQRELDVILDRASAEPLYRQIAVGIRDLIRRGRLVPGVKLPSTRDAAGALGVHRRTVVQAFHLLEEEGWLVSGVGQGTFVSAGRSAAAEAGNGADPWPPNKANEPWLPDRSFSWEGLVRTAAPGLSEIWRAWGQGPVSKDAIRFTGATADPCLFPADDFRRIIDEVFRDHGGAALDYGPTEGHLPLREWVAERLGALGLNVDVEQVLIVTGSQQGLDLVSRLLLREGDTALVEEPGYSSGIRLFAANGARVLGVPMDEGGLRPEALEHLCATGSPRLLYTMPHFQNPTGLSLDPERIEPVLRICARRRLPIIEDQFDADLFYEGPAPRPVKTRDAADQVILLGSFSKILFPGLRLGWVVVPLPLAVPLRELKQTADFSTGLLAQLAMDLYCRRGLLDRHLDSVRRIYGLRLKAMFQAMESSFPPSVRWTRPRGGLTLWVTLPPGLDAVALHEQARREGVDFSPGPLFYPGRGGSHGLRLSYIRETEERIQKGISILGDLIKSSLTREASASPAGPFV